MPSLKKIFYKILGTEQSVRNPLTRPTLRRKIYELECEENGHIEYLYKDIPAVYCRRCGAKIAIDNKKEFKDWTTPWGEYR